MTPRQYERHHALQFLYALEYAQESFEEAEREYLQANARRRRGWGDFAHELARLTYENRADLDGEIEKALIKWKIERILILDRIGLRMALCEFRNFADIPLRVTIDQYIELAKRFGGDDSPAFVNGVLDRLAADFRHKDFQFTTPESAVEAARAAQSESPAD